jgi:tetratricopeptide (TPR) repeat protein
MARDAPGRAAAGLIRMSEAGAPQESKGPLDVALAHGARLLETRPHLAEEQARAILEAAPGHPPALRLLGVAKRYQGDAPGARAVLEDLAAANPKWAAAHYELGLTLAALNEGKAAAAAFGRAVALRPEFSEAWQALGDQLTLDGDLKGADHAYARHIQASVNDPRLMQAAKALCDDQLPVAEHLLRDHLKANPNDVAAMRMLAEVGGRLGRYGDAERLLERALELAPGFAAARHNYAIVLNRQEKAIEALEQIDRVLAGDPRNPTFLNLKAVILGKTGDYEKALKLYDQVLKLNPTQPKVWMSYGHALKTAGRLDDGVAAYRRSIALEPGLGEAYWSLANLKTFRFDRGDVEAMGAQLKREGLSEDDRLHLHYALGKACEDAENWEASFQHYAAGAAIRRGQVDYDADETTDRVARSKALYTREFFAAREGQGNPAPDPIFVVGLPRSGSTLVEQILSSHSQVEGTMELTEIISIARDLAGRRNKNEPSKYPESVSELDAQALRALGDRFLERTRIQRKTTKPLFIDKMPNNFAHVGLIRLILPNAKIVDARRHPMATCFSAFKQHFARGQNFSYDLAEVGRYWRDYADLMAHFDEVLPGYVHRVFYERTVEDLEGETRRLLAFCGLELEPQCLRFWETERAVRTASSEQVRRPIFTDAVEHWRHYQPWLGPLEAALGPALANYPQF